MCLLVSKSRLLYSMFDLYSSKKFDWHIIWVSQGNDFEFKLICTSHDPILRVTMWGHAQLKMFFPVTGLDCSHGKDFEPGYRDLLGSKITLEVKPSKFCTFFQFMVVYVFDLTNKEAKAIYYTVIKHDRPLRT